jgi:hypothetical protein
MKENFNMILPMVKENFSKMMFCFLKEIFQAELQAIMAKTGFWMMEH